MGLLLSTEEMCLAPMMLSVPGSGMSASEGETVDSLLRPGLIKRAYRMWFDGSKILTTVDHWGGEIFNDLITRI
jgi:hypothetical protein